MDEGESTCLLRLFSCLGKLSDHSEENPTWEGQVAEFQLSASYAGLRRSGGEPIEFEWTTLQKKKPHCRFCEGSKVICKDETLNQKKLEIVSSSCQCSMTLIEQRRKTKKIVIQIQTRSRRMRRDSRKDIGRSLVLETKRSGMETAFLKPEGKWDSAASQMAQRFKETSDLVFTSASALSRGILKRSQGTETIHFNAGASNTQLLFRIIHPVNQLSIYGAVSNWC